MTHKGNHKCSYKKEGRHSTDHRRKEDHITMEMESGVLWLQTKVCSQPPELEEARPTPGNEFLLGTSRHRAS